MRKGTSTAAIIPRAIACSTFASGSFGRITIFSVYVMFISIVYGILGLIQSQFAQTQMRNLMFRFLFTDPRTAVSLLRLILARWTGRPISTNPPRPTNRDNLFRKVQFITTKYVAATMFALALLVAALCPMALVVTIVDNEIFLSYWPVSEHHDAVGAWGTSVAALLVLAVAILLRYQRPFVKLILLCFQACLQIVGWEGSAWVDEQIGHGSRPKGPHANTRAHPITL